MKPERFYKSAAGIGIALTRVAVGIMWIQQTLWKLPWNNFGCSADLALSTGLRERTSGLCDWTGLQVAYPLFKPYGAFVESVIAPNIQLFGWLAFFLEASIGVLLILGLLSRLGGLMGTVQAVNLWLGLSGIPIEWPWTYAFLIFISLVLWLTASGRSLGLDWLLAPKIEAAAQEGNKLARLLIWIV